MASLLSAVFEPGPPVAEAGPRQTVLTLCLLALTAGLAGWKGGPPRGKKSTNQSAAPAFPTHRFGVQDTFEESEWQPAMLEVLKGIRDEVLGLDLPVWNEVYSVGLSSQEFYRLRSVFLRWLLEPAAFKVEGSEERVWESGENEILLSSPSGDYVFIIEMGFEETDDGRVVILGTELLRVEFR